MVLFSTEWSRIYAYARVDLAVSISAHAVRRFFPMGKIRNSIPGITEHVYFGVL